jgi:pimeloyl-ACP methyl ester carboxylesterase
MHALIGGIRIEYSVAGPRAGLPVVFVHGFPFNRGMWDPQVDALKEHVYAVTYDIRGFGGSDPGDGQYSVEYFVDDLIGLLDHLKIQKAVAAGLSMGGYIVLRAAERHPDRFRGLILADTRSEPDSNEGKIKRALQARAVKRDGMAAFADSFLPGALVQETITQKPGIAALVRTMIEGVTPLTAAGTLLALAARTDTTPALYAINVPTLILVGQHDGITPPSASAAMRDKIPGAEMHVISGAGHLSNLEQPGEFNRRLQEFLDRVK